MTSRILPEYFVKQIVERFDLTEYTTQVDSNLRFPDIPIIASPNFLEAGNFLTKCCGELKHNTTSIYLLTKLTNLSRPSFKKFLGETNLCKSVYLIPKLIFEGYESPAPFALCLLHLEGGSETTELHIW